MNWRCKALAQLAFSYIPNGAYLNSLVQRYVTKSIPASEAGFMASVSYAHRHIHALRRHLHRPVSEAAFYEFGAGWDITVPLAYYGFGVERQILVDIRSLLKLDIVNDTLRKYQTTSSDLRLARRPANNLKGRERDLTALLKKHFGIDYRAPCDAKRTGLPSRSIDCISSTDTLEHIPPADIFNILHECHRILRDDGAMSLLIDYDDHYSYFDSKISCYNFLQYSDRNWSVFNPALHYQNRLRHGDYLRLLQEAGFDVIEDQRKDGSEMDMRILSELALPTRFKSYNLSELAVHNALIVARKRTGQAR